MSRLQPENVGELTYLSAHRLLLHSQILSVVWTGEFYL